MFSNYLRTAIRIFWRQKGYSFINLLGLSVGIATAIFILLWVTDEMEYDGFYENGDRIHRMMRHARYGPDQIFTWGAMPFPLKGYLDENHPEEVESSCLISWRQKFLIADGEKGVRESGLYAQSEFFELFEYELIEGSPASAIRDPDDVAISASLAAKLFGTDWREGESLLGKTLRFEDERVLMISGVFEDLPGQSTMDFDMVVPMAIFEEENKGWLYEWGNNGLRLYVKLKPMIEWEPLSDKLAYTIHENSEDSTSTLFLQPLTDVYLHSDYRNGEYVGGRIDYLRIFTGVALLILLIAIINFMNLATARASRRSREIGVRKVVGARKGDLIGQFMGEAILMALVSALLAGLLVELLLPDFNELTGKEISILYTQSTYLPKLLGMGLLTGLLAGIYPALFLSSFKIVNVLKGTLKYRFSGIGLRKGLVVFQFAMSILLIIGTATVYLQVDYIRNKDIGLDRENVVFFSLQKNGREHLPTFKSRIEAVEGVRSSSYSSDHPISVGSSTTGGVKWPGKADDNMTLFSVLQVDYDFLETMKIELKEGRDFSTDFGTDSSSLIINERTAAAIGYDDPIGKDLTLWGKEDGKIIGVIKDFHFNSLHSKIEPLVITLRNDALYYAWVKIKAGKTDVALKGIEDVYNDYDGAFPFEYRFLDDEFEETYKSEVVMGVLARIFGLIAVLISCLGLLGLSSFTAEQRKKEISIRKVLGASTSNLVMLLTREFSLLVMLSFVLAAPLAWYFMDGWLDQFAYRIELDPFVFILSGMLALGIAWLTIGYQSMRAAMRNPATSLRSE